MVSRQRWHAAQAWLGGEELDSNVLIEAEAGVITAVTIDSASDGAEQLPGVIVPGFVSAHSHAFHRLLRGRTHALGGDFWAWRQPMYDLANSLTPDTYYRIAEAVFTEMVLSGITTVGEFHYVHHEPDGSPYADPNEMGMALIDAAKATGIRMTLLDTAYLTSTVYGDPPTEEQLRFSDGSVEAWSDRVHELAKRLEDTRGVGVGIAAHSVRALSPSDIDVVATVGRALQVPAHAHVSEQPGENEDCMRAHGVTPVGLLADVGFMASNTTLVHGTHVTASDIELISTSGAGVCFCPSTEADLGDGIGPASEYTQAAVPLSLGSDSNAVIDILSEAGRLEMHERLRQGRRGLHSPASLLGAATEGGALALGWNAGKLEPGRHADFVSLDTESLDLAGTPADLASIAMSATRSSVQTVVIGGREMSLAPPSFEEMQ